MIRIGGIILAFVIGLSLAKDLIAKTAVESGVGFMTGLKLNMRHFSFSLMNTSLQIRDLKLFNPRGYPDKMMVSMPEIYVNYELRPLFQSKVHLEEVRIYLKEFVVEKNAKGELNLDALKAVESQKREATAKPKEPKTPKSKAPQIKVDTLKLKIEKVIYKDYSRGAKPFVQEFNMNLNEAYSNITNPYGIVSLIVVKVLMNTSIARLTNFDIGSLQSSVSDTLASSQKIAADAILKAQGTLDATAGQAAKELMEIAPEGLKETSGMLENTTKELSNSLSETTNSLKGKLKLPFAKKN